MSARCPVPAGKRSGSASTSSSAASTVAPMCRQPSRVVVVFGKNVANQTWSEGPTNEGVSQADRLGGDGRAEAPPIRRDNGRLADEAVDKLGRVVALLILAGHIGDVVRAHSGQLPLQEGGGRRSVTAAAPPQSSAYVASTADSPDGRTA